MLVAAAAGDVALFSERELAEWPAAALARLKAEGLLVKGPPVDAVTCPGCEEDCTMPVADVLELGAKGLIVERRALLRCVDNPVAAAGGQESAEQRRERLRKRRNELKASGVRNFNQMLAEEDGISPERIKQLLKEETASQPGNWFDLSPKGATQKKPKPQR